MQLPRRLSPGSTAAILLLAGPAAAILMLAGPAAAAPTLQYQADASCPSRQAFISELTARTQHVPEATSESWSIFVAIQSSGQQYRGDLRVDGPDQSSTMRRIGGTNCSEVVSAFALIAAVAIESTVDSSAATRRPIHPHTNGATKPEADHGRSAPSAQQGNDVSPWIAGLHGLSMGAVAPAPLQGASVTAGYEPTGRILDMRLRLSGAWLPRDEFDIDGDRAELGWLGVRLEHCPVRLAFQGAALLAPCAAGSVGRLEVEGRFPGGTNTTLMWADVGVSGHFQLVLYRNLLVDMQAAVIAPLTRNTLVFERPRAVVHETPAAGAVLGAGLAVRFP